MNKEGEDIITIVKSLEFYTQFSDEEYEDTDKIIRIFEDYGFDIDPYAMNEKYLQEFKNTKKCKSNTMEYLSILCCGVDSGKLLYRGEIPYLIGDDPDDPDDDKPNKVKRYNKIKNGSKFNGRLHFLHTLLYFINFGIILLTFTLHLLQQNNLLIWISSHRLTLK